MASGFTVECFQRKCWGVLVECGSSLAECKLELGSGTIAFRMELCAV